MSGKTFGFPNPGSCVGLKRIEIKASTVWTAPADSYDERFYVAVQGSGGAGASSGGGGAGELVAKWVTVPRGTTVMCTVGVANTSSASASSSFWSYITARGGNKDVSGSAGGSGGGGGATQATTTVMGSTAGLYRYPGSGGVGDGYNNIHGTAGRIDFSHEGVRVGGAGGGGYLSGCHSYGGPAGRYANLNTYGGGGGSSVFGDGGHRLAGGSAPGIGGYYASSGNPLGKNGIIVIYYLSTNP